MTLGATNTSNAGVDSITITDPSDPSATPNPFTLLEFTGTGTVTFPAGADQVEVDIWDGTQWVTGTPGPVAVPPAGADLTTASGVRFIFTDSAGGTIPPGASASVDVDLVQRPEVADLTAATDVDNNVTSEVALGGQTATGTANGIYTIQLGNVDVAATKSFTPDQIAVGSSSTVGLGATNNSAVPLTELSLTEPTQTTPDPYVDGFPAGLAFTGFTTGVVWPAGATGASVHYYYSDRTDEVIPAAGPNTLPPPASGATVVRFTVTFTGTIEPGESATVPFTVLADPGLTTSSRVLTNSQTVTGTTAQGTTGEADATANLTVYTRRIATSVGKSISPNAILSDPGEFVLVSMPSQLLPFPQTTTNANQIVVQDPPGTPPVLTDWWNHFNVTEITQTSVPAGATLTIQYWNGAAWVNLPGAVDIPGPQLFSLTIPPALQDQIQGLRFIYTSPAGFPPGTTVQPNVSFALRDQLRDGTGPASGGTTPTTVQNCAASAAANGPIRGSATTPAPCPAVTLVPPGTGGGGVGDPNFLDKTWDLATKVLTARTAAPAPVKLTWSTGGRANLGSMVISDVADPATTDLSFSMFNAFDLVSVPAITAAEDPQLRFDAVTGVELYNGTTWVEAANNPCPTPAVSGSPCDGTFPGVTLTAAEQASTIGVRLTFVENPDRAAASAGIPTAPPVGSGVARSTGNDRAIELNFRLRDDVRSPVTTPDPVVATRFYNTGTAGQIDDSARATGTSQLDGSAVTDTADDTIQLLDAPLNVTVSKTWTGGPLGIPQLGTPDSQYPSGRVTITATNATAANVDRLEVSDPSNSTETEPFDVFNLSRIVAVSVPSGATDTTVELTTVDGVTTAFSIAQAVVLPESALTNVVGIHVVHTGRIDPGADTVVAFDLRLRATHRSTRLPVHASSDSPVPNLAQAGVTDEGGTPVDAHPTATDGATMDLVDATISVAATKTFAPTSQTEPDDSPVTMTLSGQPGGSVRASSMTLTDDTGTFWNAFDFAGYSTPLSLTAPITQVQLDVCVGRSFDDPTLDCVASGGHWVIGTPTTTTPLGQLPAGVTNADVEGVRYTFTKADGSPFENPENPLQSVALSVQRRADLRSGGPVPSDLAGNSPAPGETAAGTFTNTMTADVVGSFNDGGAAFTASDSQTADIRYLHAVSAVSVTKTPAGVQQPGSIIPYTLSVTNTGAIAITDPVITDSIPSDASGPLLVFDPFADPTGPGPYTFALAGAAPTPPTGPALPTTEPGVNPAVSDGGRQIQFTFPPGSVLEVGQTYTITIALMFRTGLPANTQVTNTLGVTGDRPFDTCGGTTDPDTGACTTDTTVTVQTAGALRGVKSVKADDTELGVDDTAAGFTCAPDADGFYSGPCLPITKPGGTETWRLNLINTGTLPMDHMVAIDRLPDVGDIGALVTLPRGSQWRPAYTGTSVLSEAPAGAVLNQYYTTGPAPCIDDLQTVAPSCPAGTWLPWNAAVDPATVTALKFVVDFPTPIQPAGQIGIDVTTRTPGYSPTAGPDTKAWNTVAVAGQVDLSGTETVTTATEGNKVGVELATGPLSVVKAVTGAGAAFAPPTFSGTVECVSAGDQVPPIPITLTPGTPTTVSDLPWGADCTVAEADAGQTSSNATHVTIASPSDPIGVVTVTNRYDLAGLVVTKDVDSAAVDQSGQAVPYGPFSVTVDCTFLGAPVYATGYSAARPMAAELVGGQSLTLIGLPAGAECVVTETDSKGATSTTVTTTTASGTTGPTPGGTSSATLTPDAIGRPTNTVTLVNSFDVGSLDLVKAVEGPGAAAFGAGPFRLQVTCTLTDASGVRTTWNGLVTLGGTQPLEKSITDVASGSVCDVTEPFAGGANTSTVSPGQVTIGAGQSVTVTATNTFLAGAIHVVKVRQGPGVDLYGVGPFEVTLTCLQLVNGLPTVVAVPGGATRVLDAAGGYEADYPLLPAGATCVLRETGTGGATDATITDADGNPARATTIVSGETAELTDTNTFDVGSLTVVKKVEGGGASIRGGGDFVVHLACTLPIDGTPQPITIPGGPDLTLSSSTTLTATYDQLPTDAQCRLTETTNGGADATTITPNAGDPSTGTATVGDGTDIELTVVNEFDPVPAVSGLSDTGSDVWPWVLGALGMLVLGSALVRRRRDAR